MTHKEIMEQWRAEVRRFRVRKRFSDPGFRDYLRKKGEELAKELADRRRERTLADRRMWQRMRHRIIAPLH